MESFIGLILIVTVAILIILYNKPITKSAKQWDKSISIHFMEDEPEYRKRVKDVLKKLEPYKDVPTVEEAYLSINTTKDNYNEKSNT